jgi:glutamine synthetase
MHVDDPGSMSESARTDLGITKPLPKKLPEAWKYLQEDKAMVEILGEKFVESYLSVKKVCRFRLI